MDTLSSGSSGVMTGRYGPLLSSSLLVYLYLCEGSKSLPMRRAMIIALGEGASHRGAICRENVYLHYKLRAEAFLGVDTACPDVIKVSIWCK